MFQEFGKSVRKAGVLPLIAVTVFSLSAINGCKSISQSEESSSTKTQITPTEPVVVNGIRTSYADIVDRVAPAVVKVNVEQKAAPAAQTSSPFEDFFRNSPLAPQGSQRPQIERGLGSGVIVSADGTILTNHHVIEGATKITVEMNDKRSFSAKVVGSDIYSDLAVLKIDAKDLPYMNLGDSDKVRVGDIVLAIGNPLGIGQSVTEGIISAKGRRTGISDGSFEDFLQTDAPINRGNSGGALINLMGELIGINSQILSPSGGSIGIGFSIPSNMAKSVTDQLLKDGKVHRGQLGVGIQNVTEELARNLDLKETRGVIVTNVISGSASDKAGLKRGDVILSINGEKAEDGNMLRNRVAATMPGSEVNLTVLREGKEQDIKVKLDEFSPQTAQKTAANQNAPTEQPNQNGKLGLDLQPLSPEFARRLNLPADTKGVVVVDVNPDGPAADEGIQRGDVIMEINRQEIGSLDDVQAALNKAGDKPSLLLISRGGQVVYLTVQPRS